MRYFLIVAVHANLMSLSMFDFAYGGHGGFSEHLLGYTLRSRHIAAVFVDYADKLLRHRGRSVQNNGKFGQPSCDFFKNIETELCFPLNLNAP